MFHRKCLVIMFIVYLSPSRCFLHVLTWITRDIQMSTITFQTLYHIWTYTQKLRHPPQLSPSKTDVYNWVSIVRLIFSLNINWTWKTTYKWTGRRGNTSKNVDKHMESAQVTRNTERVEGMDVDIVSYGYRYLFHIWTGLRWIQLVHKLRSARDSETRLSSLLSV